MIEGLHNTTDVWPIDELFG